jgi:hypothetical protein
MQPHNRNNYNYSSAIDGSMIDFPPSVYVAERPGYLNGNFLLARSQRLDRLSARLDELAS